MKKIIYLPSLIFLFCLLSEIAFGQTIVRRYDWDANTTLGAPLVAVTQTPSGGTCTYTGANGTSAGTVPGQQNNGTAAGIVLPAGATYGVNSATGTTDATAGTINSPTSNAFFVIGGVSTCTTPRRIVTVTFPAIPGSQLANRGAVTISFRAIGLALDSATSGSGTDQSDRALMTVSLDGGTSFSNEIGLAGNNNSQMSYATTNTFALNYNGIITATPPAAGSALINRGSTATPSSRAELTIPSGTITTSSSVVLAFVLQSDRGDEMVGLDDIIVSTQVVTAASATIAGRVTDSNGQGISRTRISILNTQNGETRYATTNTFGYYRFTETQVGNFYILSASRKGFTFNTQLIQLFEDRPDIDFMADVTNNFKSFERRVEK
jgi:Carboxypeptidase regulatory-like domain